MPEPLKPMTSNCIVCGREIAGLACNDPKHQEFAAEEVMNTNAGIPQVTCEATNHRQMVTNHLVEVPLGTKPMAEAAWNGA